MADIKNYIWVFPIVGAVLGIITFIAPVADFTQSGYGYYGPVSLDWYYWIWGFSTASATYGPYSGTESGITENVSLLILSLVCTVIITIGIVALIIGAAQSKRRTEYSTNVIAMLSIGAALLLIGPIIWLIGADWPTVGELYAPPGYDFWDYFDVNFGIISPFIGAAIAFIGVGLYYYYLKEKAGLREPRREAISEKEPLKEKPITPKFCPECGQKMKYEASKFCTNCGFKFPQNK